MEVVVVHGSFSRIQTWFPALCPNRPVNEKVKDTGSSSASCRREQAIKFWKVKAVGTLEVVTQTRSMHPVPILGSCRWALEDLTELPAKGCSK